MYDPVSDLIIISIKDLLLNLWIISVKITGSNSRLSGTLNRPTMGAMKVPMLVGMMETRESVMAASIPEFLTTPVNAPAAKTMETIRNAACA